MASGKWIRGKLAASAGAENRYALDTRYQVGLKLVQIDVERPIEAEGGGDGGHNLCDEPVKIGEGRRRDAEVSAADVIDPAFQRGRHCIHTLHCQP